MAILPRKLLSEAKPNVTFVVCDACEPHSDEQFCVPLCTTINLFPPSLPSAPPTRPSAPPNHVQNHIMAYLITTVCVLGVAFLLLTTCTILLRNRWTRRRNSIRVTASTREDFVDHEDHGPIDHPIWHISTIGLQQSVIDSITAFKYKRDEGLIEGSDCSVCLTEFEDGDDLRLLPKCSHAFHLGCIDAWLRSHKNCPLCRAPVINDASAAVHAVSDFSSTASDTTEVSQAENFENSIGQSQRHEAGEGETSEHTRRRADDYGILSIQGVRIAEILNKNRELRILSDLGDNHRVLEENFQPRRRSVSLDASSASAISDAVSSSVCSVKDEGSSQQVKKLTLEKAAKRGRSNSSISRLMKNSSNELLLRKAPISMKRSFSSSGKFFSSFRHAKSQTSVLPL
ncbi:hypothetical protein Ancab_026286 [Ancistrocladus abbreviatus]